MYFDEIENEIVNSILFDEFVMNTNENKVYISFVYIKEIEILKQILNNYFDSSEYDLIKINEFSYEIQFNVNIELTYDSDEYNKIILDELKEYQNIISENELNELIDEYFDE